MEAYNILGDFGVKLYDEGIEKGKEEGLEKGKVEIARKMLKLGLPLSTISASTELSEEEIIELASKLEQKQ